MQIVPAVLTDDLGELEDLLRRVQDSKRFGRVQIDFVAPPFAEGMNLAATQVIDGDLVKVVAWYDNEWGYTNRLVEQVIRVGERLDEPRALSDPITTSLMVMK